METKKQIRKKYLAVRDALSISERNSMSHDIMDFVVSHRFFNEAENILLFDSYGSEVDTTGIAEYAFMLSKNVYYPKIVGENMEFYKVKDRTDLEAGYKGILEPAAKAENQYFYKKGEKTLVIMPGVCFDEDGARIGYGKGFYDRFLNAVISQCEEEIYKIAIAFSCQIAECGVIPREEFDIAPDFIITEKKCSMII